VVDWKYWNFVWTVFYSIIGSVVVVSTCVIDIVSMIHGMNSRMWGSGK
jgi:hypothetical protein